MIELDCGKLMGYCDNCESAMYENSAFCPDCNEVPCYLICELCWGTGEVKDDSRWSSVIIDQPYKTCPDCRGTRRKEYV